MGIKAIIIAIVALGVVGGGAYYVTSKNKDDGQRSSDSQSSEQNDKLASIKGLIEEGRDLQCTFNSTESNGDRISGTVYISNERMRGDFSLETDDNPEYKSNVLQDGTNQYFWEESSKEGVKMKIDNVEPSEEQETAAEQQSIDQDRQYDFDCSDWSVDETMFSPPGDVEFTDFSAQFEQSQQIQQNGASQRAACAQITNADARKACENADY